MTLETEVAAKAAELQAVADRRTQLLAQVRGEAQALLGTLSTEEAALHARAILALQKDKLAFEKMVNPGYWQRLWAALCGR